MYVYTNHGMRLFDGWSELFVAEISAETTDSWQCIKFSIFGIVFEEESDEQAGRSDWETYSSVGGGRAAGSSRKRDGE